MARYQLLRRLEALEAQLAYVQPHSDNREKALSAAMASDPVLAEILGRGPKAQYSYDPQLRKQVLRASSRLRLEDVDPEIADTIIERTRLIRNRLEGNPDATD